MAKKLVAVGLLGTQLDLGKGADRWERWRPSVSLCRFDDLVVDRFELLSQKRFAGLARQVAEDIAAVSPETEVVIHDVPFRDPWDFEEVYGRLHDFARSYPFDPETEDYLVHMTTGTHVAQICLFLLTESHHIPGKLVQTAPPRRQRQDGGPGTYSIIDLDLSRYDRLASRFQLEQQADLSFLKSGIETRNARFNALIERIERVAIASTAPILLTGPTGAGKSQLARRIYELKHRRRQIEGPFVEVNCATLRGDQAMSALFGHVKGAFTGAAKDRPGLLRSADRGVLFLDEIGELGADEQAMLLRAIEEKRFLPVGTDKEVASDFQLIAGTNRELLRRVQDGSFREDLLARINLWTFDLPGLRDRREDIEPNLDYELESWTRATGNRVAFNREARRRFLDFATRADAAWSGNFRDFNAAVTRMATLAQGGRIDEALVAEEVARLRSGWAGFDRADRGFDLSTVLDRAKLARLDEFDQA
ncbi:MAG: RNA repair transcriptional activator RtcR, partial [Myxococcales bacterium]|nr:RNA repair transcriptional activator RtcR [Myxococcales bacterium]